MNFNIKKYHKSIQTIPKCLICLLCTQLVQKPLACVRCTMIYCKGCYQIKNFCNFLLCFSKNTRKINIEHQIYLREIQIQCSLCLKYVTGLNYTKHIKQCFKIKEQNIYDNEKQLILFGEYNSNTLSQINDILEYIELKDQGINNLLLKRIYYCEQRIEKINLLKLNCNLCQISFNFFDIDHHISSCQEMQIKCDNKQCYLYLKRRNFDSHHLPCTQQLLNKLSSIRQTFRTYHLLLNQQQEQTSCDQEQRQVDQMNFRDKEIYPQDFQTDFPT